MTLHPLDISASGLRAQRTRLNVIANNLANVQTTRNAAGEPIPFRRQVTVFQEGAEGRGSLGVSVRDIEKDMSDFRVEHVPNHPDADATGHVRFPNVDPLWEMVDAMAATRAYEANVTAYELTKQVLAASGRILA